MHGAHLLVLDGVQLSACAADVSAWQLALHTLEQDWLRPLAAALHRGVWHAITLHVGRRASVTIRPAGALRWLRRRLVDVLARMRHTQAHGDVSHHGESQVAGA